MDFFGGRRNGAGPAKGKLSGAFGGVEPASGSMPEERTAGKRMVCGTGHPSIHILQLAEEGVPGSGIRE